MSLERPPRVGDLAKGLSDFAPFLGMGATIAFTVAAACGIGYWVDKEFGTEPVFTLIMGVTGVVAGLVQFIRLATRIKPRSPPNTPQIP